MITQKAGITTSTITTSFLTVTYATLISASTPADTVTTITITSTVALTSQLTTSSFSSKYTTLTATTTTSIISYTVTSITLTATSMIQATQTTSATATSMSTSTATSSITGTYITLTPTSTSSNSAYTITTTVTSTTLMNSTAGFATASPIVISARTTEVMLQAQEQEAAKHVLATVNFSQGKVVIKEIGNTTIAVISASAARQNGGRLQLPVSKGSGQAVEIKSSMLQELAGEAPVAVTLSEVSGNVLAAISASKKDEAKAVSPVISISLFDSSGNPLTVKDLKDPIVLTLQANATPGASCAYWDEVEGKWSQKGMQRVLDASNINGLVCSSNHLTMFSAVVGFLVDMSSAVVCSNAGAIYSLEGLAMLRQGNWWKQVPAIALWIYLFAMLLSVIAGGLWDRHQLNKKYRWRGDQLVLIDSLEDEVTSIRTGDPSSSVFTMLQRKLHFLGKALAELMYDIFCLPLKVLLRLIRRTHSKADQDQVEESVSLAEKLLRRNLLNIQASHIGLCVDSYWKITQTLAGDQLKSDFMTKVATQFSTSLSIEKKSEASKQLFLRSNWPYRLLLLFRAYHPIADIFRLSLYTPHVFRVFRIYLNLLGSAAFAALYYKGGALSRDSNPEVCLQNPESRESKLARAIGVAVFSGIFATAIAFMLSYLSGAFNLHQKDLDDNDEDECELRIAKRHIRTTVFWFFSLAYLVFSCFTICAFIAYAADSSVNDWALSSLISLLKDAVLSPLTIAAILSSALSVIFAYWPDVCSRAASVKTFVANVRSSMCGNADQQTNELTAKTFCHMGSLDSCEMISVHEPDSEPSDGPDQAVASRAFHSPQLHWIPSPADRSSGQNDHFDDILPGVVNCPQRL